MTDRYARQIVLPEVGPSGQARLAAARVLVVGAGGLGCPVLHYLAAAGIGRLIVVDPDRVEESNLHRQPLYTMADIGARSDEKARAAEDLAALRQIPGVAAVASVNQVPFGNSSNNTSIKLDPDQKLPTTEMTTYYGENAALRYSHATSDFKVRLSLAQGNRLLNHYLLAGGHNPHLLHPVHDGNDRVATTGERHGFAALDIPTLDGGLSR